MKVLVVGAGFTGASAARVLADSGHSVDVIDKRAYIAGNARDGTLQGVRVHWYGPHLFHTNNDKVFEFLSRFTEWTPYEHRVLSYVYRELLEMPVIPRTVSKILDVNIDSPKQMAEVLRQEVIKDLGSIPVDPPKTSEDVALRSVGRKITDALFSGYTLKQWGVPLSELSPRVISRIPIRDYDDNRYFTDKHQALPKDGYTEMFRKMLDHPNISIQLGVAYEHTEAVRSKYDRVIYTGSLDALYKGLPPLPYRSLHFDFDIFDPVYWSSQMKKMVVDSKAATVNFPGMEVRYTRMTNFTRMGNYSDDAPTVLCTELSSDQGEPYYPIPSDYSAALYEEYRARHARVDLDGFLVVAGRLGSYQYLNMDQACAQGMKVARDIMKEENAGK